jgi:hypothetical protein
MIFTVYRCLSSWENVNSDVFMLVRLQNLACLGACLGNREIGITSLALPSPLGSRV